MLTIFKVAVIVASVATIILMGGAINDLATDISSQVFLVR